MTLTRLSGLPLDRRSYLRGPASALWKRRNTDPLQQGFKRRTGSIRQHAEKQEHLGISCHPQVNSCVLFSDAYNTAAETAFTGTDFLIHFHMYPGALEIDSTADKDFLLFRWGGDSGAVDGAIEIYLRMSAPTTIQVVAYLDYNGGAITLTAPLGKIPDPNEALLVYLDVDALDVTLSVTHDSATVTDTGTLTDKVITASQYREISLLGAPKDATLLESNANAEPKGPRPVIAELGIWDVEIDSLPDQPNPLTRTERLTATQQADANLIAYLPCTDGEYLYTAEEVNSGTAFFTPGPPLIDTSDGLRFSGNGGVARIPWNPALDQFFTRKVEASRRNEWSLSVLIKTPSVMDYPLGNDATLVDIGPDGSLLRLELVNVGSRNYQVKATVGHGGGTEAVTAATKGNLAADTAYQITVSREDTKMRLIVDTSEDVGAGTLPADGPTLDEGDLPEVVIGAQFNTADAAANAETWEQNFRGFVKAIGLWPHAVTYTHHATGGILAAAKDDAIFYHDFRLAEGDQSNDQGPNGLTAYLEVEDRSGTQSAPPFWTAGPIADDGYKIADAGLAFLSGRVDIPDSTHGTATNQFCGYQTRRFGTDLVSARVGARILVSSGDRAHLVDEDARRIRPLGLPMPTARPGIIQTAPGPLHGAMSYAYTFVGRDGTEGPLKILPAITARNATLAIGAGTSALGASYGTGAGSAYWKVADTWTGGTDWAEMPEGGTYMLEAFARLDTTVTGADMRELVFDRGVKTDTSGDSFFAYSEDSNGGAVNVRDPWTLQVAFKYTETAGDAQGNVIAALGKIDKDNGSTDHAVPFVMTVKSDHKVYLYKATANRISNGWTKEFTSSTTLTVGDHYNLVARFDGLNYELFINNAKDGGTPAGGGIPGSQAYLVRIGLGAGYTRAEPTYETGAASKAMETWEWNCCRFWQRALPDSQIGILDNAWFDPIEHVALADGLQRDWLFAMDDPFGKKAVYDDRVANDPMKFFNVEGSAGSPPEETEAEQVWDPFGENMTGAGEVHESINASGIIYSAIRASGADWSASAFQLIWTRIGNGGLLAHSGTNLVYFAAPDAMHPQTPLLPTDPQAWAWYSWTLAVTDNAQWTISSFWVNGERVFSGGVAVSKDVSRDTTYTAHLCGGIDAPTNSFTTHLGEFRGWDTEKYTEGSDFLWLTRRVEASDYDELIYYYRMLEQKAGDSDIANDGTSGNGNDLDDQGSVGFTTVSSRALPIPPTPDIVAMRFYRSVVLPVSDFNDNFETDRLKRASQGGPFFFVGAAPAGTGTFQDQTPNESLGVVARQSGGFVPTKVAGLATWNGIPVLWTGSDLNLWVADPLNFESYENDSRIEVPARDFHAVVGAIQAGSAFYVFGHNGGVRYRGAPHQYSQPVSLGGGVGAASASCVAAQGSICFVFGVAGLWRVGDGPNGPIRERIDLPVHDLVPSVTTARLQIIGDSLHLIDTSDGSALRFHLGLNEWAGQEDRHIRGGTMRGNDTYYAHTSGHLAIGDSSTYADDVLSGWTLTGTATGGTSTTIQDSSAPWTVDELIGAWVRLIRATDGSTEYRRITDNDTNSLTFAALDGDAPVNGDAYALGAFECLQDTGWMMAPGQQISARKQSIMRHSSANWEVGHASQNDIGTPSVDTALSYDKLAATGDVGHRQSHAFMRLALRHLHPESAEGALWWADLEAQTAESPSSA